MMLQLTFSLGVAALVLLHISNATTVVRRDTAIDVASAKYDSGGGSYGGSGYSSGGGGGSYGGGGGGYGGGGYGGSGGGGYGGSGGGSYGGGGGSYGGGGYGDGGGGGGNGGSYDTGNVYYYYYPASASSSNSYGQSSGGSYYGMSGGGSDKDKDGGAGGILSSLVNLATPAVLAVVLGIPILLLTIAGIIAALAFVIGRSNDGYSDAPGIGGLVDLGLVRGVHEAFAAYQALSTDENCRKRVVCELGYILKASDKRATVVSVLDAMLPASLQKHFKPLKEVMTSGESGKCQKYICNAAAAALKAGPLSSIFGSGSKSTTTTVAPNPGQDSETQHSPPETEQKHQAH